METYLYLAEYRITTDKSIWPYSSIDEMSGLYAEDIDKQKSFYKVSPGSPFMTYYIVKSPRTVSVERSVSKISAVFSFIGGLIGAIFAALFIIKEYTSFSFSTNLAINLFRKSIRALVEDAEREKEEDIV